MGLKLAKAMGNKVTAISTNRRKEATARELGADEFVVSTDAESMAAAKRSLDLVLNTISAPHQVGKKNDFVVLQKNVFLIKNMLCISLRLQTLHLVGDLSRPTIFSDYSYAQSMAKIFRYFHFHLISHGKVGSAINFISKVSRQG
jgi:D-arabinose 1-dehydrogenase-like Zn-dependent alcohol dehydrogenase